MPALRAAFSLVPEYLRTLDRAAPVRDVSEYTPQLGRRNRALKLWVLLRWFGLEGLRRRLAPPPRPGPRRRGLGRRGPGLRAARARRRSRSSASAGARRSSPVARARPTVEAFLDERNQAILDAVNRTGEVFLSHARLDGRFVIRFALGNLRTEDRHVRRGWEPRREARGAARLESAPRASRPPTGAGTRLTAAISSGRATDRRAHPDRAHLPRAPRCARASSPPGLLLEVTETPTRRQNLADQVDATTNDVQTWRDEAQMLNLAGLRAGRAPTPQPERLRGPARHPRGRPRDVQEAPRARRRRAQDGAAVRPDDRGLVGPGAHARRVA